MKKSARIIVFLVTLIVMLFSVGCFEDDKPELVGTPTMTVDYSVYLGYSADIKGTIKNNSSKAYDYVSIEFIVYDASGNNLGTALDNISNLQAGDTWQFTAPLNFRDNKPYSFKLVEIKAW